MYAACRFERNFLFHGDRYKDSDLLRAQDLEGLLGKVSKRRYRIFSVAASLKILKIYFFTVGVTFSAILKFANVRDKIEQRVFTFKVLDTQVFDRVSWLSKAASV